MVKSASIETTPIITPDEVQKIDSPDKSYSTAGKVLIVLGAIAGVCLTVVVGLFAFFALFAAGSGDSAGIGGHLNGRRRKKH